MACWFQVVGVHFNARRARLDEGAECWLELDSAEKEESRTAEPQNRRTAEPMVPHHALHMLLHGAVSRA
ncbi:hypothetical protein N431DRAFT_45324 [Stipitochalara longipes BDJ]|nr:hypothetical protein N431DRAFT_45324 [Stipitochalara longipes BDJ]